MGPSRSVGVVEDEPKLDGIEVCRQIRRQSAVPILMLTARVDEIDRIIGLEIGADDTLCKPYSPRAVVTRVRALLRRTQGHLLGAGVAGAAGEPLLRMGNFSVSDASQRAWWLDQSLWLTPTQWRLLRSLLLQPGRVLARAQLLDTIPIDCRDVSERALDLRVKNLGRKLHALADVAPGITTVYHAGYRLHLPGQGSRRQKRGRLKSWPENSAALATLLQQRNGKPRL